MNVKQVIVMRRKFPKADGTNQGMRRGKEISQGSHASGAWMMACIKALLSGAPHAMCISAEELEWINNGKMTKATVYVDTEEELKAIYAKAMLGPNHPSCHMITDSGKTEFGGVPTVTCLAIGPDDAEKIDRITGHLPLY
jgi:PTH2 family peptidyl-tRNA hydrolase